MLNTSLKTKLIVVGAVPFIMFSIVTGIYIRENLQRYNKSVEVVEHSTLFIEVSALIHELQKERGRTGLFLKGGVEYSELADQQALTNKKWAEMTEKNDPSIFDQKKLSDVRLAAKEKVKPAPEILAQYTDLITHLLNLEIELTHKSKGTAVDSKMISITILEMAKESAGRLRANLSSILAANTPATEDQIHAAIAAKAGVDANLNSTALDTSENVKSEIKKFREGPEWLEVNRIFRLVVKNYERGAFDSDPKAFFKTISISVDKLAEFVRAEVDGAKTIAQEEQSQSLRICLALSSVATALALLLVGGITVTISSVTKPISKALSELNLSSQQIFTASGSMRSASEGVSSAVAESAAALQETSASVAEISAMVANNSSSAQKAQSSSENGRKKALAGKETMKEMISSIEAIKTSQDFVKNEISESNKRIFDLVRVIAEIRDKTKIINDIVFQTKLLSFNASVEAARAGEHGKGFAVVAEEIGNLANMSGRAAKEISEMLDKSTQDVERTVRETTVKVESLMEQTIDKVSQGTVVTERFVLILDEVVENVSSVHTMVGEISEASKEQAKGVNEISIAVSQLDQASQLNSSASHGSAQTANELALEVDRLKSVIESLNITIFATSELPTHSDEKLVDASLVQFKRSNKNAA